MSYSQTLFRIQQLQRVQMTNPPSSKVWQDASDELQPLFARMAEITRSLNSRGEVTCAS